LRPDRRSRLSARVPRRDPGCGERSTCRRSPRAQHPVEHSSRQSKQFIGVCNAFRQTPDVELDTAPPPPRNPPAPPRHRLRRRRATAPPAAAARPRRLSPAPRRCSSPTPPQPRRAARHRANPGPVAPRAAPPQARLRRLRATLPAQPPLQIFKLCPQCRNFLLDLGQPLIVARSRKRHFRRTH